MAHTYNVHFAGEVITGHELAQVREKLAKLFGANDATLDKLFSGTPRLIKKNCDRATAEKYRATMQRAGAIAIIEPPLEADDANTPPTTTRSAGEAALQLRPPQSAVLDEHERAAEQKRDVDTSALSVGDQGERLAPEAPPAPPSPDTAHLNMAETGADIPNLPSNEAPLSPNTDDIDLSPEGTDFSDCAAAAAPAPQLDLSGIDVAPEGEDLLDERYRGDAPPPAPDTDHISLKD